MAIQIKKHSAKLTWPKLTYSNTRASTRRPMRKSRKLDRNARNTLRFCSRIRQLNWNLKSSETCHSWEQRPKIRTWPLKREVWRELAIRRTCTVKIEERGCQCWAIASHQFIDLMGPRRDLLAAVQAATNKTLSQCKTNNRKLLRIRKIIMNVRP